MKSTFRQLVASRLLVVRALFPIVNPLGNAPIFLMLTRGLSIQARAQLARTIAMNGLVLMLVSLFIGTHILGFFGISLPVMQVSGNETNYMRQSFYPLTLPLTVGPGSISTAITVEPTRAEGAEWRWAPIVGLLLGASLIAVSIYLSTLLGSVLVH